MDAVNVHDGVRPEEFLVPEMTGLDNGSHARVVQMAISVRPIRARNRLGFALQLTTVRSLGFLPGPPSRAHGYPDPTHFIGQTRSRNVNREPYQQPGADRAREDPLGAALGEPIGESHQMDRRRAGKECGARRGL